MSEREEVGDGKQAWTEHHAGLSCNSRGISNCRGCSVVSVRNVWVRCLTSAITDIRYKYMPMSHLVLINIPANGMSIADLQHKQKKTREEKAHWSNWPESHLVRARAAEASTNHNALDFSRKGKTPRNTVVMLRKWSNCFRPLTDHFVTILVYYICPLCLEDVLVMKRPPSIQSILSIIEMKFHRTAMQSGN